MGTVTAQSGVRERLKSTIAWRGDRTDYGVCADVSGWWREPTLLGDLGRSLAELYADAAPTVVLGPESSGTLLGPLVAQALGAGFVAVRKEPVPAADSDVWVTGTTPPDYRDRHLRMSFPRRLVGLGDRALLVDDWIATGGQARGVQSAVARTPAAWVGTAVIVDALSSHQMRRDLGVRALVHVRDL